MRQVIRTKWLGPTNFMGSRVKASCEAGSITLPWDSSLDVDDNHIKAIEALQEKLGWKKNNIRLAFGWDKHSLVAVQVVI